jgi:hypothetical protein
MVVKKYYCYLRITNQKTQEKQRELRKTEAKYIKIKATFQILLLTTLQVFK